MLSAGCAYTTDLNGRESQLRDGLLRFVLYNIIVSEPRLEKNLSLHPTKVYSWILNGCKGKAMGYLKPLYSRLGRLA